MTALIVASLAVATWVYLLLLRGRFWRAEERDDAEARTPFALDTWPHVVAIVPARNEAELIATSVGSLLRQDYRGRFDIVVVDDHSSDGTADLARAAAASIAAGERLQVLGAPALPEGWTGKLWAMQSGTAHVDALARPPDYLLLTDADIGYAPETLTELVRRAERGHLVLTSLMARLRCESFAERALIPAFIFFFRMLYPFAWVNRPERPEAAAAGGCMLVRRRALVAAGGIAAIRHELIDDCALGRVMKRQGPVWLGLTKRARSLRACGSIGDIRRMVARSAYAQLRNSPWLLAGTVVAMAVTYLAPPVLTFAAAGGAQLLAAVAWLLMALALQPTLRFYGVARGWGFALPAIAAVYLAFTLDSAWQHWRGRGGMWKGRAHVPAAERR